MEFGVAKVIFRKKVRLLLSVLLCFSFSFSSSFYDVYPSEGNIVCVNSISLRVFLFVENFVPEGKLSVYFLGII